MWYKRVQNRAHKLTRGLIPPLLLAVITLTVSAPARAQVEERGAGEEEKFQQALSLNLQGEWDQALELFRPIADGDSPKAAEAGFYVGLCLENLPGRDEDAFQAYVQLRRRFPDSPMAARALPRQITLAGMLGDTDPVYRDFLTFQLESDESSIRWEAAFSLARLGDERAGEVLMEILREGTTDQKMMVLERIPDFDLPIAEDLAGQAATITAGTALGTNAADLQASLAASRSERERTERLLTTDRKALMEQIKRKGETWTDEELLTQGLYHVMPTDTFVRYLQAGPREKQRIYDEFWNSMEDPWPETPEQEKEQEFKRRVEYAFEVYSKPIRAARSRYGESDWLTKDNPYAPWDARGELYIRFGSPDYTYHLGLNIEEWGYSRYQVDFTVHWYKINFFRNAIYPGRASQMDYAPGWVQAHFIDSPRFEYWPKRDLERN